MNRVTTVRFACLGIAFVLIRCSSTSPPVEPTASPHSQKTEEEPAPAKPNAEPTLASRPLEIQRTGRPEAPAKADQKQGPEVQDGRRTAPPRRTEVLASAEAVQPETKVTDTKVTDTKVTDTKVTDTKVTDTKVPTFPPDKERYKVLILGDSMAATDFGYALEKRLHKHKRISCRRRGKSATGLARPDYFDWMKEAKKQVRKHKPDLVVIIIGGNDGQDLRPVDGKGRWIHWGSKGWAASYQKRIEGFLNQVLNDRRRALWLELPAMDLASFEKKLKTIRKTQKSAVASVKNADYLATSKFFFDAKGKLLQNAKVRGWKKRQSLRQEDGIHFTVPGSRYFAAKVYPTVIKALGLK